MKLPPFAFALGASLLLAALCSGCAASSGAETGFDSPSGGSQRGIRKADSTETESAFGELEVDPSLVVAVAVVTSQAQWRSRPVPVAFSMARFDDAGHGVTRRAV